MKIESTENYIWAMGRLHDVFLQYSIDTDGTFVTDRELALMNAFGEVFPNANCILCWWHICKNILARQRRAFATQEAWKNVLKQRIVLVAKDKISDYEVRLAAMRTEFSAHALVLRFIEDTWLVWKDRFVAAFL